MQLTEIVITPSARGYRVEFPELCAPSPKLVAAFRAFKWLSYHEATPDRPAYRLFPAERLEFMTSLLNHWYSEQSASALVGRSRNGSRLVTVRVAGEEDGDEEYSTDDYEDDWHPGHPSHYGDK